jgi:DNA-binding ferritin-like protein (Dps family)
MQIGPNFLEHMYIDKLGSIYIHVFKKIRSYLYTRVQGNWELIIHTCLRKLGPLYIHVFKESRFI